MYQVYKFTVLVLCASAISAKLDESLLTEELKSLMATLHKTCVDQIGIDEAQIDKLKEAVFENDEKSKCYVKCIMSESGVMDENGEVDMAAFAEVIPEKLREKTKETFEGCVGREGGTTDFCEKAFNILQCTHESNPEVTGSNKGIGFAIVKGLCEKYDGDVYLTARDSNRGEEAVKKLQTLGYNPLFHQLDIADQSSVDSFRDHIKTKHGGLDILINNAGVYANKALPMGEQAEQDVGVNYFGTLRVCEALFPLLRSNGKVVNVSSSAGRLQRIPSIDIQAKFKDSSLTIENLSKLMQQYIKNAKENTYQQEGWGESAYVVSKIGVTALSILQQRLFDHEQPNRNISVNSVHPGYVDTDMTDHLGPLTIEQGAKGPLFLALEANFKGKFVWFDCRIAEWDGPAPE